MSYKFLEIFFLKQIEPLVHGSTHVTTNNNLAKLLSLWSCVHHYHRHQPEKKEYLIRILIFCPLLREIWAKCELL